MTRLFLTHPLRVTRQHHPAEIADIEADLKTGRIWGRKFTVAHDCGLIVNPEGLRFTIEGGLVQALSRSLF
ncbi:MAG: molybdopterin-dependent oxidoreductase [Rhodoferax sp.]|nr:molybdopterin-dependent oxidoreductase [Rhodoferax sp.]